LKGKIPSILAILFALSLVLGLAASIAPASIVAAETTDQWGGVTMPTTLDKTLFPNSQIGLIALGNGTIYAAVNINTPTATTPWTIYSSTDGGYKWTKGAKIPVTDLAGGVAADIVAMITSGSTTYIASENQLYISTDGCKTIERIDKDTAMPVGTIQSMDLTKDSSGRDVIVVGINSVASPVWTWNENGFLSWKDKNLAGTAGVLAVKFATNNPKVIMAVAIIGGNTVSTVYKGGLWNDATDGIANVQIAAAIATNAVIALPSDFDIVSMPFSYIGIRGTATDNVYKIENLKTTSVCTSTKANDGNDINVYSLVITGTDATAKAFVGVADPQTVPAIVNQAQVYTGTDLSGAYPQWRPSWMAPSGQAPCVAYDGTNLYCGTSVDGVTQSAFSHATDGAKGQTWQARGLIDEEVTAANAAGTVTTAWPTSFSASAAFASGVNGSTGDKTLFMVTRDTVQAAPASVWRTTDGGLKWEKVISNLAATPKGDKLNGAEIRTSPDFATTKTAFILTNKVAAAGTLWYTTDGGNTWQKTHLAPTVAVGNTLLVFTVVDQSTVLIGDDAGNLYKTEDRGNTWKTVVVVNAAIDISDIAVASDGCIVVAGYTATASSAWISQDSGKTFVQVGPEASIIGTATVPPSQDAFVAFDQNWTTNNMMYLAASGNEAGGGTPGIYRVVVDKANPVSSAWEPLVTENQMFGATALNAITFSGFEVGQGGVLYASVENTVTTTHGVFRILDGAIKDITKVQCAMVDDGLLAGAQMDQLQVVKGSNVLFSIAENTNFINKLMKYTDTLSSAPGTVAGAVVPADKATGVGSIVNMGDRVTVTVQLSWGTMTADQYQWQVSSDSAFDAIVDNGGTDKTFAASDGLGLSSLYYWRVRATLPVQGPWSATSSFTTTSGTIGTIDTPVLGDATVVDDEAIFTWTSVLKATSYKIQVSKDYSFTSPTEQTVATTAYKTDKLDEGTYFWRVKAVPASGEASAWSAAGAITVGAGASDSGSSTPAWVWVVIVLGVILAIFVLVLILKTRRPV
jgi:hypothetical protein